MARTRNKEKPIKRKRGRPKGSKKVSIESKLIERLENDLIMLREDYEKRLLDKDSLIADLRQEKQSFLSKIALYELTILPHASREGAEVVAYQKPKKPTFSTKDFLEGPPVVTRWQAQVQQHEEQMRKEIEAEEAAKLNKE